MDSVEWFLNWCAKHPLADVEAKVRELADRDLRRLLKLEAPFGSLASEVEALQRSRRQNDLRGRWRHE